MKSLDGVRQVRKGFELRKRAKIGDSHAQRKLVGNPPILADFDSELNLDALCLYIFYGRADSVAERSAHKKSVQSRTGIAKRIDGSSEGDVASGECDVVFAFFI